MVVNEVALLLSELKLGDEASYSQFLDDLENIKLLIQSRASLGLQLILIICLVSAAEAPRAREVLFTKESPHRIPEWLATILALCTKSLLELSVVLGWNDGVIAILVASLMNIVVELLGHGVIE